MASNSLIKKKVIPAMLTAVILAISMAVSVSAESGTSFSFTLEEETVITDYEIPMDSGTNSGTDKSISPKTGDEASLVLWIALLISSAGMLGILCLDRKKNTKQ